MTLSFYGNTVDTMLLLFPDYIFQAVTEITPAFLQARGISLLLMDFDNTMLPYTTSEPSPQLLDWLQTMKDSGIRLCIVSNSRKARVPAFSEKYGVDCVTHAGKPGTRGIRSAMARYGAGKEETALVGDQIYTDVLGANLAGISALIVKSIHNHNFWLKLRHVFEVPLLAISYKRRVNREKS